MEIINEDDVKRRMGIDSWRNLSKEKVLSFVSEMPNMSKEVALKIIEQFPDFKSLVLDSLDQVQRQAEGVLSANWKSQKKVHKAFAEYRRALTTELDRGELTGEDRFRILEMLKSAVDDESQKDTEHKAFGLHTLKVVGMVVGVVVVAAAAVLGTKMDITDQAAE
ncbi:hypothetical protein [Agromyces sp. NPDC058110]|uniref:hypothetical protein n=1 Tax=Agromyces sp. NPDC058110 TaxID=3346345 RepID=UPI0036DE0D8C